MGYINTSSTQSNKTNVRPHEQSNSRVNSSYPPDIAVTYISKEWLRDFRSGVKKKAIRISRNSPAIFSHYTVAFRNRPSARELRHLLRDIKHLVFGIPALQDPKMELKYGTWKGAFFCRDEEGRLLGENTAVLNHPSIKWKERRFSDGRGLAKVNDSALRQMSRNWKQLISDISYLRHAYTQTFSLDSPLNLADLYHLSRIGTSIPSFLARRKANPVSAFRIPVRYAAIFKVLAGVQGLIITMIAQHKLGKEELYLVPNSRDIFEFGDKGGQLITPTGHACAGSRAMILELLELMIHGKHDIEHDGFSELMDDLDPMIHYGICCGRVDVLMHWNNLINRLIHKKDEPRDLIEDVSKGRTDRMLEAYTWAKENFSDDLKKVTECLRALVHHSQTRGVKSQIGSFSFCDFNIEGGLNDFNSYKKRQSEVVQVFECSMNEINGHLGRRPALAVYLDDIYKRKCDHFTDQVLKYVSP